MTSVTYARAHPVLWRRTLRGLVLRPLPGKTTLVAGSASLVWDALTQPTTVEDLSSLLAGWTGENAEVIAADVGPLLEKLYELGAVVRS